MGADTRRKAYFLEPTREKPVGGLDMIQRPDGRELAEGQAKILYAGLDTAAIA